MHHHDGHESDAGNGADRHPAPPAELIVLPRSSAAPIATATGIALLGVAVFAGWIYALVGAILLVGSLSRWLRELSHDVLRLPREQRQVTAPLPTRSRRRAAADRG